MRMKNDTVLSSDVEAPTQEEVVPEHCFGEERALTSCPSRDKLQGEEWEISFIFRVAVGESRKAGVFI